MTGLSLSILGLAAVGFSARWNWWRPAAKGLPVLMYHKIGVPPKGSQLGKLWVTPEDFRWQMEYLQRHHYSPIVFSDLESARQGPGILAGLFWKPTRFHP